MQTLVDDHGNRGVVANQDFFQWNSKDRAHGRCEVRDNRDCALGYGALMGFVLGMGRGRGEVLRLLLRSEIGLVREKGGRTGGLHW